MSKLNINSAFGVLSSALRISSLHFLMFHKINNILFKKRFYYLNFDFYLSRKQILLFLKIQLKIFLLQNVNWYVDIPNHEYAELITIEMSKAFAFFNCNFYYTYPRESNARNGSA